MARDIQTANRETIRPSAAFRHLGTLRATHLEVFTACLPHSETGITSSAPITHLCFSFVSVEMPLIKYLIACTGGPLSSPPPEMGQNYLTKPTYSWDWGWFNEIWNDLSTQLLECETSQEVSKAELKGFITGLPNMGHFGTWVVSSWRQPRPRGIMRKFMSPLKNFNQGPCL